MNSIRKATCYMLLTLAATVMGCSSSGEDASEAGGQAMSAANTTAADALAKAVNLANAHNAGKACGKPLATLTDIVEPLRAALQADKSDAFRKKVVGTKALSDALGNLLVWQEVKGVLDTQKLDTTLEAALSSGVTLWDEGNGAIGNKTKFEFQPRGVVVVSLLDANGSQWSEYTTTWSFGVVDGKAEILIGDGAESYVYDASLSDGEVRFEGKVLPSADSPEILVGYPSECEA